MCEGKYLTGSSKRFQSSEPALPHLCRIHLYSDMWRHFDAGLHVFMHTYIYQPLVGTNPSVLGRELLNLIFIYRTPLKKSIPSQ